MATTSGPVAGPNTSVLTTILTLASLPVAWFVATLSLWLMPVAGLGLVAVGRFGLTHGVTRWLAHVVTAIGGLLVLVSVPAFIPA